MTSSPGSTVRWWSVRSPARHGMSRGTRLRRRRHPDRGGQPVYGIGKGAIGTLTPAAAQELGKYAIRVDNMVPSASPADAKEEAKKLTDAAKAPAK